MSGVVTSVYKVEWNLGAGWVDITTNAISVTGAGELTGNRDNALAFGDSSNVSATVVLQDTLAGYGWQRKGIRITYTISGVAAVAFAGVMTGRSRNSLAQTITIQCMGYAELIRTTKAYSPLFYRRSVATKTTTTSQEDPAIGGYVAGLVNYILWSAGGRPLEQNFNSTYQAAAKFWYSSDQALIAPLWTWIAGEDGWAECLKLAQASGGQVYQANDGTVRYRQPYGIADVASTYTFDEDVYDSSGVDEQETTEQLVDQVSCSYVSRQLRATQKIVEETNSRIVQVGETATIVVEPSWPLYALDLDSSGALKAECFSVAYPWFGTPVLNTDYSVGFSLAAQRITLTFTNLSTYPLIIWSYRLNGQPVVAGHSGNVTIGSGATQRAISDNVYIQTEHDARRLAKLVKLYYGAGRPVRSIRGCVYDPSRYVGEVVGLTCARFSLTASAHIILSIKHDDTGLVSDYDLAYVGDLNLSADYFQVGPTYSASKKITV
jgi:hypothetical protein